MDYPTTSAVFVTPRGTPVTMVYREGTNDFNTLRSCLDEDEYNLRDRHLTGWAADIGAYIGGVAVALAVDNPNLRVLAVEPIPANLALLRENVAAAGVDDRVGIIAGAVGDGRPIDVAYGFRGDEAAEHHAFVGNSSLAHGRTVTHDTITYDSLTLLSLLSGTGPLDLLKIDVEGAEYDFFGEARIAHLEQVETILGEWHNVHRGEPYVQTDICDLLWHTHNVTFSGPVEGPGGFVAERL